MIQGRSRLNLIDLWRILYRQPLRPFRLRLSLNITAEVRHPEFAILRSSSVSIHTTDPNEEMAVSLSHIVTLEYLPRKKP